MPDGRGACNRLRMSSSVRDRMTADLPAAIKARDAAMVSILRTTLAAIANAEAVDSSSSRPAAGVFGAEVARRDLSDDDVREIVAWEHKAVEAAADEMRRLGQGAAAAELARKAEILEAYLA